MVSFSMSKNVPGSNAIFGMFSDINIKTCLPDTWASAAGSSHKDAFFKGIDSSDTSLGKKVYPSLMKGLP